MEPILTRAEWDAEWQPIDPHSLENVKMGLMAYAARCNRIKKSWKIPWRFASNARYEVYVEGLLREGVQVSDDILRQIDPHANNFYDVPSVGARLIALGLVKCAVCGWNHESRNCPLLIH